MTAAAIRLRRIGVAEDDPAALASELRSDILGEWLPLALADMLCAWCGGSRSEILRSWGLEVMADRMEEGELDRFLSGFGKEAGGKC